MQMVSAGYCAETSDTIINSEPPRGRNSHLTCSIDLHLALSDYTHIHDAVLTVP